MLSNIAHAFGGFNNLLHKFAASKGKKMQKRLFAAAAAANLHNKKTAARMICTLPFLSAGNENHSHSMVPGGFWVMS